MEGRKPPVLLIPCKSGGGVIGCVSLGGALHEIVYGSVDNGGIGRLEGAYAGVMG